MFKIRDYSEWIVFQYSSQEKMHAEAVHKTPISSTFYPYSSRFDKRERYFYIFIIEAESTIAV